MKDYLLIGKAVEIIEYLESGGELPDRLVRARLHELTAPKDPGSPLATYLRQSRENTARFVRQCQGVAEAQGSETTPPSAPVKQSGTKASPSTEQACSTPNYELAESERLAWAKMDLDARLNELVQWIKQNGPETARARINALTRKYTMSDKDLQEFMRRYWVDTDARYAMIALRDRYEERGEYAPDPNAPAMPTRYSISPVALASEIQQITDRPDVIAFVLELRSRYEGEPTACDNCRAIPAAPEHPGAYRCSKCKRPVLVDPSRIFTPDRRPGDSTQR